MEINPTDEQRMLAQTARAFLEASSPTSVVRELERSDAGFSADHWGAIARLGWTGLLVPDDYGGAGRGLLDLVVLCEEFGRALFPSPLAASSVLAGLPVLWAGTEEQRRRYLPRIADGSLVATLALLEPGARDEWHDMALELRHRGDALELRGTKTLVPFAGSAQLLLVAARSDKGAPALVAVEPQRGGVESARLPVMGGEPLYEVSFRDARVDRDALIGRPDAVRGVIDRALDHAAVAGLAFMVGAAERTLEMTVAHARSREQFGRPIGEFQAVAHRCVDMRSDIDACRYLAYQAAWSLDAARDSALEVGAAKAFGNEALRRIFMHAQQVHGAIGFSTEYDLQLYTRRAKAFELTFGGVARHRERVARAMGL
ncbi:MAG: acyl-CoA dehydrogenase family protein [Actinomycetota bacterium]